MPKAGATLPEALLHTAGRGAGQLTFHLEDGPVRLSVSELAQRAQAAARTLAARGVAPGDAVGVLGPNRPEWAVWAWATWMAGAALVPIQIPLRVRDPDAFAQQLRSIVDAARCRLVLADPRLLTTLPEGVGMAWDESPRPTSDDPPLPRPDDAAVIQFTSGSTATPKGALITHRAVLAQMDTIETWWRDPGEHVLFGWVPFFHDLGLFAYVVLPGVFGSGCHYLPTERFAADPAEWFRLLESEHATLTHFPPSAIGAAIRATERRSERVDLSSLRLAVFAGEAIDPHAADQLLAAARRLRLAPEAVGAAYGLAEAVLGVTSGREGEGLHFDRMDIAEMAGSGRAVPAGAGPARRLASCGRPAPGTEVRIGRGGEALSERQLGEIHVRGPSLMRGYVGPGAPDPFADGWLQTGDLGYLADGQLYVTGRIKDMVIVMGQNYYPEDFEWAAGRVSVVRTGRCAAFSNPETEQVVVLVEPGVDGDPRALSAQVHDAIADSVGIAPADVVVVPRGTIEKTTSGKLRRSAMRDAYVRGELPAPAGAQEART